MGVLVLISEERSGRSVMLAPVGCECRLAFRIRGGGVGNHELIFHFIKNQN